MSQPSAGAYWSDRECLGKGHASDTQAVRQPGRLDRAVSTAKSIMRIVFDSSTLHQGSSVSRPITGVLCFEFAGQCFPDERWSDFPVVITSWWLEAVANLQAHPKEEAIFRFMDGPYFVGARRVGNDLVNVRYVEDRLVQTAVHEEQVALVDLVGAVHSLARDVVSACEQHGLSCRELAFLKPHLPN